MTNKLKFISKALVLLSVQLLFLSLAVVANDAHIRRIRRKVGNYEGPGPLEYMRQLQDSMSSIDGVPNDLDNSPTSIWCLLDRDILEDKYHPKSPNKRCHMEQTFVYNISSLIKSNSNSLPLSQGKLRLYMQPIDRLIPEGNSDVAVEVSIITRIRSSTDASSCSGPVLAAQSNITINQSSTAYWSEWNITDGMLDCWGNNTGRDTLLVTVQFRLQKCVKGQKKIPIMVVDPATIPISQKTRRDRHWPLQPIVVLFLDDETKREELIASSKTEEDEPIIQIGSYQQDKYQKRSIEKCERHELNVTFAEIDMHHILFPLRFNAYQCSGGCAPLNIQHSSATNHARIVSAVLQRDNIKSSSFSTPSCTASSYNSLAVLEVKDGNINYQPYPDMIVKSCECRA